MVFYQLPPNYVCHTATRNKYHEFKPPKENCRSYLFAKKKQIGFTYFQSSDKLKEMPLSWREEILKLVQLQTIELSFAHSEEYNDLRYVRYRGISKVKIQVLFTASIQNLKKWSKLRALK